MAEGIRFSLILEGTFDRSRDEQVALAQFAFTSLGAKEGKLSTFENQFSPNATELRGLSQEDADAYVGALDAVADGPEAPPAPARKRAKKSVKK